MNFANSRLKAAWSEKPARKATSTSGAFELNSKYTLRPSISLRPLRESRQKQKIRGVAKIATPRSDRRWTLQNSILPWKAIMRGELSPPRPTPSKPVGGEIVLSNVPNRAGMKPPGTPAWTELGSAKLGWL